MTLFNGLICLAAAGLLLFTLWRVQDTEPSQILKKLMWLSFTALTIIGVHHTVVTFVQVDEQNDYFVMFLRAASPVTDLMHALAAIVLCYYVQRRYQQHVHDFIIKQR